MAGSLGHIQSRRGGMHRTSVFPAPDEGVLMRTFGQGADAVLE